MGSSHIRRDISIALTAMLIIGVAIFFIFGPSMWGTAVSTVRTTFYTKVLPKSKKITIKSESINYHVDSETSEFAKNYVNELHLFDGDVILHHKTYTEKVQIREMDVIFTDEPQYWPGLINKSGTQSSFDFYVDETNKGTLKIWINPNQIGDEDILSLIINRTYFISLYIIKNWETYQNSNEYFEYFIRLDSELYDVPIQDRPIRVTN